MSASLLQKSLKLTDENKESKKKSLKKKKLQNCKWRRITRNSSEAVDKNTKESILNNIRKLEELDKPVSLEISQKIFSRKFKLDTLHLKNKKEEEKTVFTDKDFEEFEKEYLAS